MSYLWPVIRGIRATQQPPPMAVLRLCVASSIMGALQKFCARIVQWSEELQMLKMIKGQ
jgi:hypothetical protein